LADDLTGACASAALCADLGLDVRVRLVPSAAGPAPARARGGPDVLALATQSRLLPPAEAGRRAADAAAAAAALGVRLLGKRIDSTLRGNVGAEVDGALTAWQSAHPGVRVRALIAAAHPRGGRTVLDGRLHVGGRPLGAGHGARDAQVPPPQAGVAAVVARQSGRPTALLALESVRALGPEALADRLAQLAGGADIVIADGESEADIERVAAAVDRLERRLGSVGSFLLADPGPAFAARLRCALAAESGRPPALVVAGSVVPSAVRQVDALVAEWGAPTVVLDPAEAVGPPAFAAGRWAEAVAAALAAAAADDAACAVVRTATVPGGAGPLAPGEAAHLDATLAHAVRDALGRAPAGALVLTGGEVAAAVCAALGVRELTSGHEVEPLAAHAHVVGGSLSGLDLCTKGGLVGDDQSLVRLVRHVAACRR
jgi:uncharacterized protein YgbK (DUF1537 family)